MKVIEEVKVRQVKEKVLPELTDEFAKSWEAESVEKLREGVRDDLKSNQEGEAMRVVRTQVHEELMKKVSFAVPEPVQQNELRIVVESMVRTRRAGGASEKRSAIDIPAHDLFPRRTVCRNGRQLAISIIRSR